MAPDHTKPEIFIVIDIRTSFEIAGQDQDVAFLGRSAIPVVIGLAALTTTS
jgi:hypothetical protein